MDLIRGFSAFQGQGRFVNYTTQSGAVKQGLMLYGDTTVRDVLDQQALKIPDIETAKQFMGEWTGNRGIIATSDARLQIRHNADHGFVLMTEAARSQGGKFYLDAGLLEAAGGEFTSSGRSMRMDVPSERIDAVLELLMQQRQYKLLAHNEPIIARHKFGTELPGFVPVAPILPPEAATSSAPGWPNDIDFIQPGLFGNVAIAPQDNPLAMIEAFILDTLPERLAANADWQSIKWSDQPETAIKASLKTILERELSTAPPAIQAWMTQADFADRLTDQVYEADYWQISTEFNYDHDADRATRLAEAQIILDVGAQVYAFGAANDKLQGQADGSWCYAGKEFSFSYEPDIDRFTVSDLNQGTVIAASVANVVTTDDEVEPTVLERFERLGQAISQAEESPRQSPRQSYEQAVAQANSQPVTSADLATWQQQVAAIGRSPEYCIKLAQAAATCQETGKLTPAANAARLIDQQQWQQQVDGMAANAHAIVQSAGIQTQSGQAFAGSIFRIVAEGSNLSVHAKERGVILRVEQGQVVTANINQQDAERFAKQATALRRDRPNPVAGMEH